MATKNYLQIISQAISDFNAVETSILKKVRVDNSDIFYTDASERKQFTTGVNVPTKFYGELVDQLVKIDGIDGSSLNRINAYTTEVNPGLSLVTKTATINPIEKSSTTTTYSVLSKVNAAGYYTADATLALDIPYSDIVFAKDLEGVIESEVQVGEVTSDYYVLDPSNYVIGKVSVKKGSTNASVSLSNDIAVSFGDSTISKGALTNVDIVSDQAADSTNYYYVDITNSFSGGGTVNATVSNTAVEGYITSAEVSATDNSATVTIAEQTKNTRIALKKGQLSVTGSTDPHTVGLTSTQENIWLLDTATDAEKTAAIKVEASSNQSTLTASVTEEGYVASGTSFTGSIAAAKKDRYIKRTETHTVSLENNVTASSTTTGLISGTETAYAIVSNANASKSEDFGAGYLSNGSFTATASGNTTTYITAGAATVTATATASVTDNGGILSETGADATHYKVTASAGAVNTAVVDTLGVISASSQINAVGDSDSKDAWIKKGSITVNTPVFSATFIGHDDDGYGHQEENQSVLGDIFKTSTQGFTGDYFKVDCSAGYTLNAGYIKAADVAYQNDTDTTTRYIPKAKLAWSTERVEVDGEEKLQDVLRVSNAGYLPAGVIFDILEKDENGNSVLENAATVSLSPIGDSGIILQGLPQGGLENDYYKITIAKNVVDPGYISFDRGSLINNEFFVKKGSVSATPGVVINTGAVTEVKNDQDEITGYSILVGAKANGTIEVEEGYISSDVDMTEGSASTTINLTKASLKATSHTADLSIASTSTVETVSPTEGTPAPSKYTVGANIRNCSAVIDVNQSGYITEGGTFTFEGCSHEDKTLFIKEGSASSVEYKTAALSNTLSSDLADTSAEQFTITATAAVSSISAEIATGYYGAEEKSLTAKAPTAISGQTGTLTINRGKVTVGLTDASTTSVVANGITLHDSNNGDTAGYVKITSTANIVTSSTVTDGYINNAATDVTEIANATLNSSDKFIQVYKPSTDDGSVNGNTASFVVGPNAAAEVYAGPYSKTLDTDAKYIKEDINVTIGTHAMGSAVNDALTLLENRLLGIK